MIPQKMIRPKGPEPKSSREVRREIRWPAIRKPPLLRSIASVSAPAAARPAISSTRPPIPRGFVKAELDRPGGVLLEPPALQSTPALAQAVFAYQFEIVQARNAAAKSGANRAAMCRAKPPLNAPTSPEKRRRWRPPTPTRP